MQMQSLFFVVVVFIILVTLTPYYSGTSKNIKGPAKGTDQIC